MFHNFKYKALALFLSLAMALTGVATAFAATETNVYDDLGRLIRVEYDDGTVLEYTYDEVGNRLSRNYVTTLNINYDGPGTGTTLVDPVYENCGDDCYQVNVGLPVTLTPQPIEWSIFAGWAGLGCEGMVECTININTPSAVTASYDVCTNYPARVIGVTTTYYNSLWEAYNAAQEGDVIQSGWTTLEGDLNISKSVSFEGGYNCDYSAVTGVTTIVGDVNITNGSVSMGGFEIVKPSYALQVNIAGVGTGTIQFDPPGAPCGAGCYIYAAETEVTLSVINGSGSILSDWIGGGCSGNGNCTVTVGSATSVTANFGCTSSQVRIAGATPVYYNTFLEAYTAAGNGSVIQSKAIDYNEMLNLGAPVSITLEGGYSCDYSGVVGETGVVGNINVTDGDVSIGNFVVK